MYQNLESHIRELLNKNAIKIKNQKSKRRIIGMTTVGSPKQGDASLVDLE